MIFHFDEFDIERHLTDMDWHLTTDSVVGCHGVYHYVSYKWAQTTTLYVRKGSVSVNDYTGWFVVNYGEGSIHSGQYNKEDYEEVRQCVICYGRLVNDKIYVMDNPDNRAAMVLIHQPEPVDGGFTASHVRLKYYNDKPWLPKGVEMREMRYINRNFTFNGGVITWTVTGETVPSPSDQWGFSIGDFQKYNAFNPNLPDEISMLYIVNSDNPSKTCRKIIFQS